MPPKKPAAKAGKSAPAKGGGKMIAALKARQEALKKLEEEEKNFEEQQKKQFEEEERLRKAEEKRLAEEKKEQAVIKKKEEKMTKEDAKTKAKREAIERMIASGMVISGLGPDGKPVAKPQPAAQPKKKKEGKPPSPKHVDPGALSEEEDWEAMFDKEQEAEAAHAAEPSDDDREYADDENTMHKGDLRCPICCVLGHVDAGKTSLLDKIRRTNVATGEAGGITQQIGATFMPADAIEMKTACLKEKHHFELRVPGLLIIDTPGHESFSNLRSRGSSLCDIAIVVVNFLKGLEPQTRESLRLLRDRHCPFIVAMNQVDRLYGWKSIKDADIETSLAAQENYVLQEYETKLADMKRMFAEEGFNAEVYYRNQDIKKYVSMVPTSAMTGEGLPDLLMLKCQLVQRFLETRIAFSDELRCTVLEVKKIEGLGTSIDVILVNGKLEEGQTICICGMGGPIVTQIRALLTPPPMRETRVKSEYIHHKKIYAAKGLKIVASDLEDAVPGTPLFVVDEHTNLEAVKKEVMKDLSDIFSTVDKSGKGVAVQASTLGSLEALLTFLKDSKIPVSTVSVGPIHKRHIITATANAERNRKYAVLLAFDVEVTRDAQHLAEKSGIKILTAGVIYHLFDQFKLYVQDYEESERRKYQDKAVFPCVLKITQCFRNKEPIILGCQVERGSLRLGTPLSCFVDHKKVHLGKVIGIERDNKVMNTAKKGTEVAVKVHSDSSLTFGRHFDESNELYSEVTRDSIDALKQCFREQVDADEWLLIRDVLKKKFAVM